MTKISRGVLRRTAREDTHLLRQLNAWAFHSRLIDAHAEVRRIEVHAEDTHRTYSIDRERFMQLATRRVFSPAFGEQLALPLECWAIDGVERVKAEQPTLEGMTLPRFEYAPSGVRRGYKPAQKWLLGE